MLVRRETLKRARPNRWFALRRAIGEFRDTDPTGISPALLARIVYGWGNEDWSARPPFLAGALEAVNRTNGPILECGAGISSLLIGVAAPDREVFSLEQDPGWAKIVTRRLRHHRIRNVHVLYAPLRDYGEFSWYGVPPDLDSREFGLVICDGPTGEVPGNRVGLLPVMAGSLSLGCEILLDDMTRVREQETLAAWESGFAVTTRLEREPDPYAVIVWGPSDGPHVRRRLN